MVGRLAAITPAVSDIPALATLLGQSAEDTLSLAW
jgi:hypothetical protein